MLLPVALFSKGSAVVEVVRASSEGVPGEMMIVLSSGHPPS